MKSKNPEENNNNNNSNLNKKRTFSPQKISSKKIKKLPYDLSVINDCIKFFQTYYINCHDENEAKKVKDALTKKMPILILEPSSEYLTNNAKEQFGIDLETLIKDHLKNQGVTQPVFSQNVIVKHINNELNQGNKYDKYKDALASCREGAVLIARMSAYQFAKHIYDFYQESFTKIDKPSPQKNDANIENHTSETNTAPATPLADSLGSLTEQLSDLQQKEFAELTRIETEQKQAQEKFQATQQLLAQEKFEKHAIEKELLDGFSAQLMQLAEEAAQENLAFQKEQALNQALQQNKQTLESTITGLKEEIGKINESRFDEMKLLLEQKQKELEEIREKRKNLSKENETIQQRTEELETKAQKYRDKKVRLTQHPIFSLIKQPNKELATTPQSSPTMNTPPYPRV